RRSASSPATTPSPGGGSNCSCPRAACGRTSSRPRCGCTRIRTPRWPSSTARAAWPATRPAARPSAKRSKLPRDPLRRDALPAWRGFKAPPCPNHRSGQLMCYQNRSTPSASDRPHGPPWMNPRGDAAAACAGGRLGYNVALASPVHRRRKGGYAVTGETVLIAREGGVTRLTLNRPDKLNAFTLAMHAELRAALEAASTDAQCRVVVLTGAGRAFCAGQDLAETR